MAINNYQNVPTSIVPRDIRKMEEKTHNIYESIVIMSKRANQISAQMKEELQNKLQGFDNESDTLEEVFENREQIEISMQYEKMPKATLLATEEFLEDKIYFKKSGK
ncbi:MAG: DNA-directed RNA polymerase subunit omega [Bacteroidia bacterium]